MAADFVVQNLAREHIQLWPQSLPVKKKKVSGSEPRLKQASAILPLNNAPTCYTWHSTSV